MGLECRYAWVRSDQPACGLTETFTVVPCVVVVIAMEVVLIMGGRSLLSGQIGNTV